MRFNGEEYRITSTAFGRGNGCTSYQTETSEGVCFSEPEQILCVDSKSGIRRFDSAAENLRILVRLLVSDLKGICGSAHFRVDFSKALNPSPDFRIQESL